MTFDTANPQNVVDGSFDEISVEELGGWDMVEQKNGLFRDAKDGRSIWFLDALLTWKATGKETNGWELVEQLGPRGFGPPLHWHDREAEGFYVLDGEVSFIVGEQETTASAGSFVFVPPGMAHSFVVESPVARFLTFITPPALEAFLDELAEPATEFVNPFETLGASNQWVDITSSAGRLIHAGPGNAGGWGGWRTNRSGCAA